MQSNTGVISITTDGWTIKTTKEGILGMTAHWIHIEEEKWTLKVAVIGFKVTIGGHDGDNIGRYMVGITDRVGITSKTDANVCLFVSQATNW